MKKFIFFLSVLIANALVMADGLQLVKADSIIYITNTSGHDVKVYGHGTVNDKNYHEFNCLFPITKGYSYLKTAQFRKETEVGNLGTYEYVLIPAGKSYVFGFNSKCDSIKNSEDLIFKDSNGLFEMNKMFQERFKEDYFYVDTLSNIHILWGYTQKNDENNMNEFPAFEITILPD